GSDNTGRDDIQVKVEELNEDVARVILVDENEKVQLTIQRK
ncbi:25822_t:CDS:1, partial [Gigaspora rosea]